jgi:hypothetical protein
MILADLDDMGRMALDARQTQELVGSAGGMGRIFYFDAEPLQRRRDYAPVIADRVLNAHCSDEHRNCRANKAAGLSSHSTESPIRA